MSTSVCCVSDFEQCISRNKGIHPPWHTSLVCYHQSGDKGPLVYFTAGHITEEESLFNYSLGDTSYSAINDGYLTYRPLFTDDLNVTDDVFEMCHSNLECVYDYLVTGSMEIGQDTFNIAMDTDNIIRTLSKSGATTGDCRTFANLSSLYLLSIKAVAIRVVTPMIVFFRQLKHLWAVFVPVLGR